MPRSVPLILVALALLALLVHGCGYPTIEGEACTEPYPTADLDATGECDAVLGVRWNGTFCSSVSGCSCQGPGCDDLFDSLDACEEATRSCDQLEQ